MVRKQVKALTVLYLVPCQHFGVYFAPYQILLVMGAVFVLLAIPFLLFYMKQEIFAPMTALVSTMDRIGRGELSVRSSVDYRTAEFTQVNELKSFCIEYSEKGAVERELWSWLSALRQVPGRCCSPWRCRGSFFAKPHGGRSARCSSL